MGEFKYFRQQLGFYGRWLPAIRRAIFSPLTLSTLAVFLVALIVLTAVSISLSRRDAREVLKQMAFDMTIELDNCVDPQLEYIGQTLCDRFRSPENMRNTDLNELMRIYAIDEINVVNADGLCINSTVDCINGQDQYSLKNPAKFCEALLKKGKTSFSQPFRESASEAGVFRKYVGVAFEPPAKGYIQIGFDRVRLKDEFDFGLRSLAHDWHVGEAGFYVISKTLNGIIVSSGREEYDDKMVSEVGFDVFAARMNENEVIRDAESQVLKDIKVKAFTACYDHDRCLCTSGVVNQYLRYVVAIPYSEVYGSTVVIVSTTAIVLFLVFVLVVAFMTGLSDKHRALQLFIKKDQAQRQKDMSVASLVQSSSLPVAFPNERTWRVAALMDTAREVGGDFYDFYKVPSGRILVLIADVSGKGISAAMFMMRARTIIKACMFDGKEFGEAVSDANCRLAEHNEANMFVTVWLGALDLKTGELEFVNAGHNPPLLKRADGSVEWIRTRPGMALAAWPGVQYRAERLQLKPGDSLLLYTDGVTEAQNPSGEFFGEARLAAALKAANENFVSSCREQLRQFVSGAEQADDITMLALDFKDFLNKE